MPNQLDAYQATSVNWRQIIRQNTRRTYFVIFLFFIIYGAIGIIVDLYLNESFYPNAPLSEIFIALITLQILPIATVIMLAIAGISLIVSFLLHDRLIMLGTNYHEITPQNTRNTTETQLYNVVEEMKIAASLNFMPRVFIIDADYMNAFASGYSEKSAMVAITRGLLQKLNRDELQAVMAHELSHIRHLDIKITLTASLLANLSIIVLDILFRTAIFSNRRKSGGRSRNGLLAIIMLLRFLLPIISVLLLFYLSRKRELMADAGCVQLMRANEPLASALIKIQDDHKANYQQYQQLYQQTPHENIRKDFYIYDPSEIGIKQLVSINDLFSTHPSLAERLNALGFKQNNST